MKTDKFKIVTADGQVFRTIKPVQISFSSASGTEVEAHYRSSGRSARNLSFNIECRLFSTASFKIMSDRPKVQLILEQNRAPFPRKMKKAIKTGALNTKFARKAKNYLNRHPIIKLDGELSLLQGTNLGVINVDTHQQDAIESVFSLEDYLRQASARMSFPGYIHKGNVPL